jgi:hypothetical protein
VGEFDANGKLIKDAVYRDDVVSVLVESIKNIDLYYKRVQRDTPHKLIEIGVYLNQEFGNASAKVSLMDAVAEKESGAAVDEELKGYVRTFRELDKIYPIVKEWLNRPVDISEQTTKIVDLVTASYLEKFCKIYDEICKDKTLILRELMGWIFMDAYNKVFKSVGQKEIKWEDLDGDFYKYTKGKAWGFDKLVNLLPNFDFFLLVNQKSEGGKLSIVYDGLVSNYFYFISKTITKTTRRKFVAEVKDCLSNFWKKFLSMNAAN